LDIETITQEPYDHKAIAKGAGWAFIGQAVYNAVRFAIIIVVTKFMTTSQVGLYRLGYIVSAMVRGVGQVGTDYAVVRFVAEGRATGDEAQVKGAINFYVLLAMGWSLLLGALLLILAHPLAIHYYHKPQVAPVLRAFAPAVPATVGVYLVAGILRGLKDMRGMVLSFSIVWPCAVLALGIVSLLAGGQAVAFSWMETAGAALAFALGIVLIIRQIPVLSASLRGTAVPMLLLGVAIPLFLTDLVGIFTAWLDEGILGSAVSLAQVGIYSIGKRAAFVGGLPVTSLNQILSPFVAEAHGTGDRARLASVYETGNRWGVMTSLPLLVLLFAFVVGYLGWFGKDYVGGALAFRILVVGQVVTMLTEPAGYMLSMTGRQTWIMWIGVAVMIVTVAWYFILIPRYGMVGAATALSMAVALRGTLQLIMAYRWSKMLPWGRGHLKTIWATVLAAIPTIGIVELCPVMGKHVLLLVTSVAYVMLYVVLIWRLGLNAEDRVVLRAILQRMGLRKRDEG